MASELEIDEREIIYTWTSYYHENQHEIDSPTNHGWAIVTPFVETAVEQQHIQNDEHSEVNPDAVFDIEMLPNAEIVDQRGEQIADIREAGGSK